MKTAHLAVWILLATASLPFVACEKREGALERTGEKLDEQGKDVGEKLDESADDIKDAGDDATKK